MLDKMLNIRGTLTSLATPLVMGILNITPDSFYAGSRKQTETAIEDRIREILSEGGDWIDIGGYSSRPDAAEVTPEEEMRRLEFALHILNKHYPDIPVSVDTFRAGIARRCVEEYGVAVINDISGGELDADMFQTVADLKVPYIMMHMRGTPQTMQRHTDYPDMMEEIMLYFSRKVRQLRLLGVYDIILSIFELPLLVGVSRKSMIYKLLGGTPADSLNGTTVLNTYALLNGANILRVHDVREAVEAIRVIGQMTNK